VGTALLLLAVVAAGVLPSGETASRPPAGRPVALVTAETQNALLAVSLQDGRVMKRVRLPADPQNIEVGNGGTAVLMSTEAGAVSLVDWRSLRVIKILRGFRSPHIAAKAPDGEWVYVSDDATGILSVIELARARVVARLYVGLGAHHMGVSPDEHRLWIALGERARTIVIVGLRRPDRPRVVKRFDPGFEVHDLAFSPSGRTVWVTTSTRRSVEVFNARTARRLYSVPAGAPPQHVVFSRRFAYVTSGYDGRIEMANARTGRVLRSARVPYGSFNLATAGGLVVTSSLLRGTVTELSNRLHVIRTKKVAPAARDVALVFW
jgi:DNA-binding beta-propeller fold protein YncE